MTTVSETSRSILSNLLAGPKMSKEVAEALSVKTVVVTGSLAGLKKNGFVEITPAGALSLTASGRALVAPATGVTVLATTGRKGAMKANAAAIVSRLGATAPRKEIVAAFKAELNMSDAQASTYHYNLCGDHGMWRA